MAEHSPSPDLLNDVIDGRLHASPFAGDVASLAAIARSCGSLRLTGPDPAARARMRARFWSRVEGDHGRWLMAGLVPRGLKERMAAGVLAASLVGGGAGYVAGYSPAAALRGPVSFVRSVVLNLAPGDAGIASPLFSSDTFDAASSQERALEAPSELGDSGSTASPAGPAAAPSPPRGNAPFEAVHTPMAPTSPAAPSPSPSPTPRPATPTVAAPVVDGSSGVSPSLTGTPPPGQTASSTPMPGSPPPPSPSPAADPSATPTPTPAGEDAVEEDEGHKEEESEDEHAGIDHL